MKRINLLALFAVLFTLSCTDKKAEVIDTVHLKGQLVDMGSTDVSLSYDGASSMIGDSRDIHLITDNNGYFDTVITVKEPAFYRISRNTLYLTPGDDMTVKITTSNTDAEFQGKGAQANNYMKYRLFPHGGSYLEAGRNIREDFESTKSLIDSLADVRRQSLNALDSVSTDFKTLENARINADVINSYIMYLSYSRMLSKTKNRDEADQMQKEYFQKIAPYLQPLFKSLNDEKLLDVAVVRDVLGHAFEPYAAEWVKGLTFSPRIKELYETMGYTSLIRSEVNSNIVDSVKNYIATLQNEDFAIELNNKLEQASRLLKGQPAFDVEMEDVDGNVHHLSDLKGKVLYVDFWATWCGPCCEESPYFESLSKKYADKDIVFVPISTDKSKKAWLGYLKAHKKELKQYNTTDPNIRDQWGIFYIPRFILIDKDFKIVNAYAPRPSSEEIIPLIDSVLN